MIDAPKLAWVSDPVTRHRQRIIGVQKPVRFEVIDIVNTVKNIEHILSSSSSSSSSSSD